MVSRATRTLSVTLFSNSVVDDKMIQSKISSRVSYGQRAKENLQMLLKVLLIGYCGAWFMNRQALKETHSTRSPMFSPGANHTGILCLTYMKTLDTRHKVNTVHTL